MEIIYNELTTDFSFKSDGTDINAYLQNELNQQLREQRDLELNQDGKISFDQQFTWNWANTGYFTTIDTRSLIKMISWMMVKRWHDFINFYEVIEENRTCKFYAIVDVKRQDSIEEDVFLTMANSIKDEIIRAIINFLSSKGVQLILSTDVLLFTVNTSDKLSYHIVIDNYEFENRMVIKDAVHEIMQTLSEQAKECLNMDIYDQDQLLTLYSCKEESEEIREKRKNKKPNKNSAKVDANLIDWSKIKLCDYDIPDKRHELKWTFEGSLVEYELLDCDKRLIEVTNGRLANEQTRIMMNIMLKHSLVSCRGQFYDLKKVNLTIPVELDEVWEITPIRNGISSHVDLALGIVYERYPELVGVYTVKEVTETLIVLDRILPAQQSQCPLCHTLHTTYGAFVSILNERGDVTFLCRKNGYETLDANHLGPIYPQIDVAPNQQVLSRLIMADIISYEDKIYNESLSESEEVFEITLPIEPDDVVKDLLDTYRLIPFAKEPDQNRFKREQLEKITKHINPDKFTGEYNWLVVTGMIKSCRLRYEEYQPQHTEDEILKLVWLSWIYSSRKYSIYTNEWMSQLWNGLETVRNGRMKFNSFDLLKLFKEKSPVVYDMFMEGNKNIRTFNYTPRSFTLPLTPRLIVDRYTQDRIKPLDRSKPIELIKSKMDTQKTRSLLDYINNNDDLEYIIYVTIRYTMSQDASQVLASGTNRDILFYKDIDEIGIGKINPRAIIVIQLESLQKLVRNGVFLVNRPDLLILDECTSCCTQLSSPTMKGHEQSIKVFRLLLKTAVKIVAMDADVDERIIRTLMQKRTENIHVQWNDQKYQGRSSYRLFNVEQLEHHLLERLEGGENVFIVCSTRSKAHELRDKLGGAYPVRCHTGFESADDKKDLFNVNDLWIKYRVVIITSTVTVGVNFFKEHFDSMFIFGQNGLTPSKRDLKQMTGRVRKLKTGFIFFHLDVRYYNIPITYDGVFAEVMREYKGRVSVLENLTEDRSATIRTLASEILVRYKSAPKFKLIGGEFVNANEEDSWITQIHVLNMLERNISNSFFEEEFEFMFKEQGISVTHIPITPLGSKITPDTIIRSCGLNRMAHYEETDIIPMREAERIKKNINKNCATSDERFMYSVYTVCKHLIKKPPYPLFEHFEKKYPLFMRMIADLNGDLQRVLKYEKSVFVHRIMNTGIFHQWTVMKDFEQLAKLKNTVDPFEFNTFDLQVADPGTTNVGQIGQRWSKWMDRAIDAFVLPNKPVRTVKSFMNCLRKILLNWTGLLVNELKRITATDEMTTLSYRTRLYTASRLDDLTLAIIPLLVRVDKPIFIDDDIITELDIVPDEECPVKLKETLDKEEIIIEIIDDEAG